MISLPSSADGCATDRQTLHPLPVLGGRRILAQFPPPRQSAYPTTAFAIGDPSRSLDSAGRGRRGRNTGAGHALLARESHDSRGAAAVKIQPDYLRILPWLASEGQVKGDGQAGIARATGNCLPSREHLPRADVYHPARLATSRM
jgi:hypothetical protein